VRWRVPVPAGFRQARFDLTRRFCRFHDVARPDRRPLFERAKPFLQGLDEAHRGWPGSALRAGARAVTVSSSSSVEGPSSNATSMAGRTGRNVSATAGDRDHVMTTRPALNQQASQVAAATFSRRAWGGRMNGGSVMAAGSVCWVKADRRATSSTLKLQARSGQAQQGRRAETAVQAQMRRGNGR